MSSWNVPTVKVDPSSAIRRTSFSMFQMRSVFTPVVGSETTSENDPVSSKQLHSIEVRLTSTEHVMPRTSATAFIASRTRHAPAPPASNSNPARHTMDDLSESDAFRASSSWPSSTSCQWTDMWFPCDRRVWRVRCIQDDAVARMPRADSSAAMAPLLQLERRGRVNGSCGAESPGRRDVEWEGAAPIERGYEHADGIGRRRAYALGRRREGRLLFGQ